MAVESFISQRFPYLPISVVVGERRLDVEAFIDTGFEGDIALPDALIEGLIPHDHQRYEVAGGRMVSFPLYRGEIRLASFEPFRGTITGADEAIAGLYLVRRYGLLLDHGARVVVES
jgi:predicted aspartyl protease